MLERKLTVCKSRRSMNHTEPWPAIVLDGRWLKECGFAPGDKVSVCCGDGKLIIKNSSSGQGGAE